ncbi:MAG TPA: hypothetical protein VMT20_10890 [Terriglobia bacterium]|nr:hypothetical protein [Terriglobia bacterium]
MGSTEYSTIEIACPCCGARLKVDTLLGRVVAHEDPPKPKRPEADHLNRASEVLQKQAEQREAHFRSSAEEEKIKSDLLARKFEEALKKSRGEPVTRPQRDIDLD